MMFNLLPRDTVFFDLFEGLARQVVATADHLHQLAKAFPDIETYVRLIREEEHAADDLAHNALNRLDQTFITPYDREDIHTLVIGLDDIVDTVDAIAKRFHLYHIRHMEPAFIKQAEILHQATLSLAEVVGGLRKRRKLSELSERIIEIHRLENMADDNNHAAVSKLFDGSVETLEVIKWKGLYDLIENAVDGCEDSSNTLERIILKNG